MTERWEELYSKALKQVKFENPSLVQQMIINTAVLDGVRKERERIIALLKSAVISAEDANYLIALIKGEN